MIIWGFLFLIAVDLCIASAYVMYVMFKDDGDV